MKETQICTKLKNELNKHGTFWKIADRYTSGIPDIVGCYGKLFIGVEVKIHPNKPTLLQERTLHTILNCFLVTYFPKKKRYLVKKNDTYGRIGLNLQEVVDWILKHSLSIN